MLAYCYFDLKIWTHEENAHTISTIRVNFEWTKHIRQMKPKSLKNPQEDYLCSVQYHIGTIESFKDQDQINQDTRIISFLKKSNRIFAYYKESLICINDGKQKVLKDHSPLIDGLLLSILMNCFLNQDIDTIL